MTAVIALTRKQLVESRWMLGISAVSLFLLCWLFVFVTNRIERADRGATNPFGRAPRAMIARQLGGASADDSSTSLELAWWRHPMIVLVLVVWPISRGSAAIAGELEKGSLDLVLSRPISRNGYLTAQILAGLIGMCILAGAMVGGTLVGNRFNYIESPPSFENLARPAVAIVSLGVAIYGITVVFSSIDIIRWRPTLIASVLTLAMYIAPAILGLPALSRYKPIENASIFLYYDPVEAGLLGVRLWANAGKLLAVGAVGIFLAYIAFNHRDLPANA